MTKTCTVSNQNCEQPAGWGGAYGFAENIGPFDDIPSCYRCGESVCETCGRQWLAFWFCPGCWTEQGDELLEVVG